MPSEFTSIHHEIRDGVARITLDRPPLNILNIAMMEEVNAVLEQLASASDYKVLLIDHRGKAFSAGVDVKDHTEDKVERMIEVFHRMFRLLGRIEAPTVAAVRGAALGGGCELATFCDLVVASQKATFGQPEIKVGVFPPVAAVVFPGLVGRNRCLELVLTGEVVDAEAACRIGLINRVFPDEGFEEGVQQLVGSLTSLSGAVLRLAKKAVDRGLAAGFQQGLAEAERIYLKELMSTEDAHEGLKAFVEKRSAQWKDR